MSDEIEQLLQQAISAARSGNKNKAKELLTNALHLDNHNARTWYLLSQIVDNKNQIIHCLEQVLKFDPGNKQAKARLEQIRQISLIGFEDLSINSSKSKINPVINDSKSKNKTNWTLIIIILGVVAIGCFCFYVLWTISTGKVSMPTSGISKFTKHDITYRIEGTANAALITYSNDQGGTEQLNNINLPWEQSYKMDYGGYASLVAQSSDYGNTITCIIKLDGKEWKRSSSAGDFVIATCIGWIGLE
jgi:hypothetical protein